VVGEPVDDRGPVQAAKDWRAEEPENLFPQPSDALGYIGGLAGFWGGIGAMTIAASAAAPGLVVVAIFVLACVSIYMYGRAVGSLERRITGRSLRSWPFGYASLRVQLIATMPSTVMAAAERLKWHAVIVTLAMYSLLVVDFVALVVWGSKR
jgi:hypothetical protein